MIKKLLFWEKPAEYVSKYSLAESIKRLKENLGSEWNPFHLGISGKVSEKRVRIYRSIPLYGNSFIPIFTGLFERSNDKVILYGKYSMHAGTKIFTSIWLSFVILLAIPIYFSAIRALLLGHKKINNFDPLVLIPLGMLVSGILLVKFGQWLSRNDIAYISERITNILNNKS